ncbi:MAG: hypothetical protein MI867_02515 [Pseudomonadales bacterium]|nr:hypothetical protein [Pseudomonadales bacterium]
MTSSRIIRSASVQGIRKLGERTKQPNQPRKKPKDNEGAAPQTNNQSSLAYERPNSHSKVEKDSKAMESEQEVEVESFAEPMEQPFNQSVHNVLLEKHEALEQQHHKLQEKFESTQAELAKYESDIEALRTSAIQEGHEQGVKQAAFEHQAKQQELDKAFALFSKQFAFEQENANELALEIALAALAKVLGEEYKNPEFVKDVIVNASRQLRETSKVKIRLNEGDLKFLEPYHDQLNSEVAGECELSADARVSAGGCILETDAGNFDARLDAQIQLICDALMNALKAR